jgi:hypothetical protein
VLKQTYEMSKCGGNDIGGHPPFPTGSKQFSNFSNLLFLNFWGHFEGLNEGFWGFILSMIAKFSH